MTQEKINEVNMHSHSYYSDGSDSPEELVLAYKKARAKAGVLTDHDNCRGVREFLEAAEKHGLDTLPGIEISAKYKGTDVHILGYGYDPAKADMVENFFKPMYEARNKRIGMFLDEYRRRGIMDIDVDELKAKATGGKGPFFFPTLIREYRMKMLGLTVEEAETEINRGGTGGTVADHVPRVPFPEMHPVDALKMIRDMGGKGALAHPGEFVKRTENKQDDGNKNFTEVFEMLVENGLFGIEAYYWSHTPEQIKEFLDLAKRCGLHVTAGSDYHGIYAGNRLMLSGAPYDYEDFKNFKREVLK